MLLSFICRCGVKTARMKPGQENFLNLIKPPTGSHIPLTTEEKQKINKQIDEKMQELEDTGLSKEEIVLSKSQKGIPLASDPFFQYLKRNRAAREVYLKKTDRFTVQKIIDIALRQDIGPDPSYSRTRNNEFINPKGRAELMNDLPEREPNAFDPASYDANSQTNISKLYDELKPHQPLRHIYSPVSRYERMKTHMRKLKKYDIHWRNVELLGQFITRHGNIKSRFANRLSSADQKKITMTIKTARHNCAIPHYGRILNPNKKNITSLEDEVKELGLQNVNIQTGSIYYSRSRSMDSLQTEFQINSDVDHRYKKMLETQNHYQLWLDTPEEPQDPAAHQKIIESEKYARALKIKENQELGRSKKNIDITRFTLKHLTELSDEDNVAAHDDSQQAQNSFNQRKEKLKKTIESDVLAFSRILLEEKTLM